MQPRGSYGEIRDALVQCKIRAVVASPAPRIISVFGLRQPCVSQRRTERSHRFIALRDRQRTSVRVVTVGFHEVVARFLVIRVGLEYFVEILDRLPEIVALVFEQTEVEHSFRPILTRGRTFTYRRPRGLCFCYVACLKSRVALRKQVRHSSSSLLQFWTGRTGHSRRA